MAAPGLKIVETGQQKPGKVGSAKKKVRLNSIRSVTWLECKTSVSEEQSFSEAKVDGGLPICKNLPVQIMEQFRIIFLNIKLSVCVWRGQVWQSVLDVCELKWKQMWFCHEIHCHMKITGCEHISLYHPQIQAEALPCREEAIREHDPETPPSLLCQSSFKMKWRKVISQTDISNSFMGNTNDSIKRDHKVYYQHTVQKPASGMVCQCLADCTCRKAWYVLKK